MDVVSLGEHHRHQHHDTVDRLLMVHQEKDIYIQTAGSLGLFFELLVSETAWNPVQLLILVEAALFGMV